MPTRDSKLSPAERRNDRAAVGFSLASTSGVNEVELHEAREDTPIRVTIIYNFPLV